MQLEDLTFSPQIQAKLLEIQEFDRKIAKLNSQLAQVPGLSAIKQASAEIKEILSRREEVKQELVTINEQATAMEEKTSKLEQRIQTLKQAQISGEGLTSRDLLGLEQEIALLEKTLEDAEVEYFGVLGTIEQTKQNMSSLESKCHDVAARGKQAQADSKIALQDIQRQLDQIQQEREKFSNQIPAKLLELYEDTRMQTGGIGVRQVNLQEERDLLPVEEVIELESLPADKVYISAELGCILVRG